MDRPVNNDELLAVLTACTTGYGTGARLADRLDMDPCHLRQVKSGRRMINQRIARELGYELRWVKIERPEKATEKK